jgi:hypothetical protein
MGVVYYVQFVDHFASPEFGEMARRLVLKVAGWGSPLPFLGEGKLSSAQQG